MWTELFHRSVPFLQVSSHPHKVLLKKQMQAREDIELAEKEQQQLETGPEYLFKYKIDMVGK